VTFEENALVRHTKMPSWGVGRILKFDHELVWIQFSGAGLKKLKVEIAAEHLAPAEIAAAQPAAGQPERSRSAPATNVGSRTNSNARCAHCDQLLKRSQHRDDGAMKSCPNCSVFEGEHVYYPYPQSFGARAQDPGRDQTDCDACRANASLPHEGGTFCSRWPT
jgi:hypothetical protein